MRVMRGGTQGADGRLATRPYFWIRALLNEYDPTAHDVRRQRKPMVLWSAH